MRFGQFCLSSPEARTPLTGDYLEVTALGLMRVLHNKDMIKVSASRWSMMTSTENDWAVQFQQGLAAYESGNLEAAERALVNSLQNMEASISADAAIVAELYHLVANVYRDRDDFSSADYFYQRAIADTERAAGETSTSLMRVLRDYTMHLCLQGKFCQAARNELQAFAIANTKIKRHKFEMHFSVSRLCALYFVSHDYARAEVYYRRYLAQIQTSENHSNPYLASVLNDFGLILYRIGKYQESEMAYRSALEIMEAGSSNDTAKSRVMNALGLSLCAQHREDDAKVFCSRARSLRSSDDMTIIDGLHDLADSYCDKQNMAEARVLCEAASAVEEDNCFVSVQQLAESLTHYANILRSLNFCEKIDKIEARIARLQAPRAESA